MKKTYVLDTNILLVDAGALSAFDDNILILPLVVLEELDRFKNKQDDVGACARQVNRELDKMRSLGSLIDGVPTPGGGILRVATTDKEALELLPIEFSKEKVDHIIIAYMLWLQTHDVHDAVLVSKDINVRIKCDSLGVKCQDYLKMRAVSSEDKMYTGVKVLNQPFEVVNELYKNKVIVLPKDVEPYYPNQIVVVKCSDQQTALTKVSPSVNNQSVLRVINDITAHGLQPRNKEQRFALDLLLDDSIKLVTLTGPAGCVTPDTKVTVKLSNIDWNIPDPDDTY